MMAYTVQVGVLACVGVAVLSVTDISHKMYEKLFYDNNTAFVSVSNVKPLEVRTPPGKPVFVDYQYKKRPGCIGTVTYRIKGIPHGAKKGDDPILDIPLNRPFVAAWPSNSKHEWIKSAVTIPDFVPKGVYELYWVAVADECKKTEVTKAMSPGHALESISPPIRLIIN